MKNQNHLYLSKLKKTKYTLEKSLNDLEQYDLDEESIRMIKILKDRIKENQKQIIALEKEINSSFPRVDECSLINSSFFSVLD